MSPSKYHSIPIYQKINSLLLKQQYSKAQLLLSLLNPSHINKNNKPSSPYPTLPQILTYSFLHKIHFPHTVQNLVHFKNMSILLALSSLTSLLQTLPQSLSTFLPQTLHLPILNPLASSLLQNLLLLSALFHSNHICQKKPTLLFLHHLFVLLITLDTLLFLHHLFLLHSPLPFKLFSSLKYSALISLALLYSHSPLKNTPFKHPFKLPLSFLPLTILATHHLTFLYNSFLPLHSLLYPHSNPPPIPHSFAQTLLPAFLISFLSFPLSFLKYPHSFFLPYSKVLSFLQKNPKFQNLSQYKTPN